jgi:glycerophosphoryl diester phosphodiesterase
MPETCRCGSFYRNQGQEIRAPQDPFSEEASAVRIINAGRAHAQAHANHKRRCFRPGK